MKIASVQMDILWHDKTANLAKASQFIQQAAKRDCELIIFPEMFNSGYSMRAEQVAEPINGLTLDGLCNLAKQHQIKIIAGLAIEDSSSSAQSAKNMAVYIDQAGQLASQYCKNYPFTLAGEKDVYATGDQQAIFQLEPFAASLFICYDLRFPELFRKVAKQVDLMVVIASWPSTRQNHWEHLLQARAIENQCFVIGVNRIGSDGNQLEYTGGSMVCDPMGNILSRADATLEYIETRIELAKTQEVRKQFPFLKDMKV